MVFHMKRNFALVLAFIASSAYASLSAISASIETHAMQDPQWAFIRACEHGYTDKVQLLMRNRAIQTSFLDSLALKVAAENGHAQVVRLLLNDPSIKANAENGMALRLAQQNNHRQVVTILSGSMSNTIADPVLNAIQTNNINEMKSAIDRTRGSVPKETSKMWFLRAIELGYMEVVKALDQHPYLGSHFLTAQYQEGMELASFLGHLEIVKYLHQKYGVYHKANACKAPIAAASQGHLDVVKYFDGPSCSFYWNELNGQAIVEAATNGHHNVIDYFSGKTHLNLNVQDGIALKNAVRNNHEKVVEILAQNYFSTRQRNDALKIAKSIGNYKIISILENMRTY